MAEVQTGDYILKVYTAKGGQIKELAMQLPSETSALEAGRGLVKSRDEVASFTIDRRIYNSLDDTNRY